MILLAVLIGLLCSAALCFGLSRALPTRLLGMAAALACLGGAALLATTPLPAPDAAPLELLVLGEASFTLHLALGGGERALGALLLGGGGAALLALAGALGAGLRGFGPVLGWALLSLAAALLSLAAPPLSLVQPLAWAVLATAGYSALRASGVATADDAPPRGLTLGLLGSALLVAALLVGGSSLAVDALPTGPTALLGLLAALALVGAPPLLVARQEAVQGPAPIGALLYGLAAPAAGLGWLLRMVAELPLLPTSWAAVIGLVGALGAFACGCGALGERGLRPLLAWTSGAQAALVVAAAGLSGPLAALAGPALLASLMLSAVVGAAAAVTFERTAGDDDYTALLAATTPRLAATIWGASAAVSLGLPPSLGGWGRLWLLETALEQQPWLLAPLLASGVLLGLALVAPLAGLWAPTGGRAAWTDLLPALLAFTPLLLLGAAPELAWAAWLRAVPFAPPALPVEPAARLVAVSVGALLALLVLALLRAPLARNPARDPDEAPTALAPEALGAALRPLAYAASPVPLLSGIWGLLGRISQTLRLAVSLFEQRYYLLGVLAALLTIMLLMAQ
jgi:hypothetical protein